MSLSLDKEGVRIPIWISTLLVSIVIPALIGVLGDNPDWKAITIEALITASILLSGGEVARRNVYSAETVASIEDNAYGVGNLDGYKKGYSDAGAGDSL